MSELAIQVQGISKQFHFGAQERYRTLRESLIGMARKPLDLVRSLSRRSEPAEDRAFWALRDVTFDVRRGEVMGVVGKNGAGKSTLLKVLSRITEPTNGYADIWGRVGSLLEVGTGFHSELSGRDNIYMSGSMLGMRKAEIDRKFDEIVAFAEVDKFIDTPVKRYSSGMYMRLGFAVAAHLEPEILLVDEVLAVGDSAFQKKCLGKMDDVAHDGRTVLFVSHNMAAMQALCHQTVWLEGGQVRGVGPTRDIVAKYLESTASNENQGDLRDRRDRIGDGSVRIISARVDPAEGGNVMRSNSRLMLTVEYEAPTPIERMRIWAEVEDFASRKVICAFDSEMTNDLPDVMPARGKVVCTTESLRITPGRCPVTIGIIRNGMNADEVSRAVSFDVEPDEDSSHKAVTRTWALTDIRHGWKLEA